LFGSHSCGEGAGSRPDTQTKRRYCCDILHAKAQRPYLTSIPSELSRTHAFGVAAGHCKASLRVMIGLIRGWQLCLCD
jgi:hypothetical protein